MTTPGRASNPSPATNGRAGARSAKRRATIDRLATLPHDELLAKTEAAWDRVKRPDSTRFDLTKYEDLDAALFQTTGKYHDPYGMRSAE